MIVFGIIIAHVLVSWFMVNYTIEYANKYGLSHHDGVPLKSLDLPDVKGAGGFFTFLGCWGLWPIMLPATLIALTYEKNKKYHSGRSWNPNKPMKWLVKELISPKDNVKKVTR